jgi:hypothetical protein
MSKNISLFSGYSQKENRTTNYCLLILKLIYEENIKIFGEILTSLIGEEVSDLVGVEFRQQEKLSKSIPDGLIFQKPFAIYFETKNFNWFYDSQLENHLESIDKKGLGKKILIALSNLDERDEKSFDNIKRLISSKYKNRIFFTHLSFEDFVEQIKHEDLPKNLKDMVFEFEDYLNQENLLSNWRGWIDVVNCVGYPDDILIHNVYMCPASSGPYNHGRCEYFGMYRQKKVERVGQIIAVIDVESRENVTIKWINDNSNKKKLKELAIEKVYSLREESLPVRIFLLGELFETNFLKDSRGGMQSSKQYFDIRKLEPENANDLAIKLNGKTWSEIKNT